jgi:hypothetical protein
MPLGEIHSGRLRLHCVAQRAGLLWRSVVIRYPLRIRRLARGCYGLAAVRLAAQSLWAQSSGGDERCDRCSSRPPKGDRRASNTRPPALRLRRVVHVARHGHRPGRAARVSSRGTHEHHHSSCRAVYSGVESRSRSDRRFTRISAQGASQPASRAQSMVMSRISRAGVSITPAGVNTQADSVNSQDPLWWGL